MTLMAGWSLTLVQWGFTADVRISNVSLAKTDHTSAAGSNDADAEGVTQAEWFKEALAG